MNNDILNYFGTLEKSENLIPITIPGGMDTLVFESQSPFSGYYDDYPGKHNDATYLYLAIDSHRHFVELHRVILQAYKLIEGDVDMDHARLHINHHDQFAIRLRSFKDLSQVPVIQKILSDLGIQFTKKRSKNEIGCRTRIAKYFSFKELEDGIWLDEKVEKHGYIEIPKRVELEEFKTIVRKVRNNWDGYSFDAGLAALCMEDKLIEMARIYSKHVTDEDYLQKLKKVFLSAFSDQL